MLPLPKSKLVTLKTSNTLTENPNSPNRGVFVYNSYMILGIDEVGRGPWAGPLVVGAVVLDSQEIEGLTDSKKLTKKRRESLATEIKEKASAWALGWVSPAEIDELGLSASLKLATMRAVEQIKVPYHEIIIDGTVNFLAETGKGKYVTTLKKADSLIPSVSAASIIAKVARDDYMAEQSKLNPEYGFEKHVGYGTAVHKKAIEEHGVTELHRKSFRPVAEAITSKQLGNEAESIATNYLSNLGHNIIERNWRTKWCEIDIISEKDGTIFFVEVKYRKNNKGGTGLDAITNKKLKQMKFAAELYSTRNNTEDLRLMVVSMSGDSPGVDDVLEIVEP